MKSKTNIELTKTEWVVLECLWEGAPKTVMQIVGEMKDKAGWAKSTSTTMVKRMADKGLLLVEEGERAKLYYPAVDKNDATERETESFLNRVYRGSVGMMMSSMVKNNSLTKEDIKELHRLLDEAAHKEGK